MTAQAPDKKAWQTAAYSARSFFRSIYFRRRKKINRKTEAVMKRKRRNYERGKNSRDSKDFYLYCGTGFAEIGSLEVCRYNSLD